MLINHLLLWEVLLPPPLQQGAEQEEAAAALRRVACASRAAVGVGTCMRGCFGKDGMDECE